MDKILTKEEWLRRRHLKRNVMLVTAAVLFLIILLFSIFFLTKVLRNHFGSNTTGKETITQVLSNSEEIKVNYLSPNPYSRPQTALKQVKGIVIHYTANPGTSAENNRSYFQGLATKKSTKASSHYIIGLDGEIIQCIPLTEQSFASNDRNDDTISIECCHPDETGKFSDKTYESLVALTAALCMEYDLQEEDVIRHYDVTEKLCPLYYVEHEDAWVAFKQEVVEEVTTKELN